MKLAEAAVPGETTFAPVHLCPRAYHIPDGLLQRLWQTLKIHLNTSSYILRGLYMHSRFESTKITDEAHPILSKKYAGSCDPAFVRLLFNC